MISKSCEGQRSRAKKQHYSTAFN